MTVAILFTRLNRSNIRIYVNEVSSTYQIYCFNVYFVTTYFNFSLKKYVKVGLLNRLMYFCLFFPNN